MELRSKLVLFAASLVAIACEPSSAPVDANRIVDLDAAIACTTPASRAYGEHCRCAADCSGEAATCLTEEISSQPQGTCAPGCADGVTCPDGLVCTRTVCYTACTTNADCAADTICTEGACLPFCDADADCLSGNCNEHNGRCLPPGETPTGAGLDAPCAADEECLSDICTGGRCTTPCAVSVGACPEGGVCAPIAGQPELGICYPACSADVPCTDPERRCAAARPGIPDACLPTLAEGCLGASPSPNAGSPCGCDADCDEGSRCITEASTGFPHGLCILTCTTDAECGATHRCLAGICLERCTFDDACGIGRLCPGTACYPYCVTDSECLSGHCDTYRGQCDAPSTAPGGIGATCASADDCRSGICDTATHPDGSCFTYCSVERGECPDGAICVAIGPGRDAGACHLPCTTAADCPQAAAVCRASTTGPSHCE